MSKENEKNLILSKNTEFDEDQKDHNTSLQILMQPYF